MVDRAYVAEYFTKHARHWLSQSYPGNVAPKYPLGEERVRRAADAVRTHWPTPRGRVVDIGCGGGQLCFELARMGYHATGLDLAPGMVAECENAAQALPTDVRERVDFALGEAVATGLPGNAFVALTALGLIEYLPDDDCFFSEARRLLQPNGLVVVTARNRLFNMGSANSYTQRELSASDASLLVAELRGRMESGITAEQMHEFVRTLKVMLPQLEEAVQRDLAQGPSKPPKVRFRQTLRQHTPLNLAASADEHGFDLVEVTSIHPHPFPPALERDCPHTFNALAQVWATLGDTRPSLAWSSCFQGVFRKRAS